VEAVAGYGRVGRGVSRLCSMHLMLCSGSVLDGVLLAEDDLCRLTANTVGRKSGFQE
jgi:hypothetical protein